MVYFLYSGLALFEIFENIFKRHDEKRRCKGHFWSLALAEVICINPFRFPETQDDSFWHGKSLLVDGLLNWDHRKLCLFRARTLGIYLIHLLFIFDNSHLRMWDNSVMDLILRWLVLLPYWKRMSPPGRRSRAVSILFDNTSSKINRAINMVFKGGMWYFMLEITDK